VLHVFTVNKKKN